MKSNVSKKKHESKDTFFAKLSFWFAIFSWIPLFNFGLSFAALYFGIKSIRLIISYPDRFGGRWMSIIGIVIGATIFISSVIFTVIYLLRRLTCDAVCALI